eukprot:55542-Eustigmatos_ZCMA.PRE.1
MKENTQDPRYLDLANKYIVLGALRAQRCNNLPATVEKEMNGMEAALKRSLDTLDVTAFKAHFQQLHHLLETHCHDHPVKVVKRTWTAYLIQALQRSSVFIRRYVNTVFNGLRGAMSRA